MARTSVTAAVTRFLRTDAAFPLLLLLVFIGGVLLSSGLGIQIQVVFVLGLMVLTLGIPVLVRVRSGGELAFFLLVPTIISATQNVYLLAVVGELSASQVRFLIIINFVYAVALFGVLELTGQRTLAGSRTLRRLTRVIEILLVVLVVYAAGSAVVTGADPISALASLRNFVTPLVFTLIGLYGCRHVTIENYLKHLLILGGVVIAFGIVELAVPSFWQTLGLGELWVKKGLRVNAWGLPGNFRASEHIGDLQFTRMVGPFADPVHLGTFLFAVFMVAWFLRKRILAIVAVIAMVLTVSKGALLGMLAFVVVWPRYFASRTVHIVAIAIAALGAVGFYLYTLVSSSGSTMAHIKGLLNALADLPLHPFGRGLGNAGVLARRFDDTSSRNASESGLGVIIGQLGIVGLLIFAALFVVLLLAILRIESVRSRCLALVLLIGFVLNAAFNEVALSPNSAAPYFIILGLLIGREFIPGPGAPPPDAGPSDDGQIQGPAELRSSKS